MTARRGMQRLRGLQHFETGAAAHLQVADDDVEEALVQLLDGGVAVRRLLDVVAGFGHRLRQAAAERVVVVGDQNPSHVSPSSLSFARLIPAASPESSCPARRPSAGQSVRRARRRSSERWPVPARSPAAFVVKNGSKTLLRHVRRNPGPLSATSTSTASRPSPPSSSRSAAGRDRHAPGAVPSPRRRSSAGW